MLAIISHIATLRRALYAAARAATTPEALRSIAVAMDNLELARQLVVAQAVIILERDDLDRPLRVQVEDRTGMRYYAVLGAAGACTCGATNAWQAACIHRLAGRLVQLLELDAEDAHARAQRRIDLVAARLAEREATATAAARWTAYDAAVQAQAAAHAVRTELEQAVQCDDDQAAFHAACRAATQPHEREAA